MLVLRFCHIIFQSLSSTNSDEPQPSMTLAQVDAFTARPIENIVAWNYRSELLVSSQCWMKRHNLYEGRLSLRKECELILMARSKPMFKVLLWHKHLWFFVPLYSSSACSPRIFRGPVFSSLLIRLQDSMDIVRPQNLSESAITLSHDGLIFDYIVLYGICQSDLHSAM